MRPKIVVNCQSDQLGTIDFLFVFSEMKYDVTLLKSVSPISFMAMSNRRYHGALCLMFNSAPAMKVHIPFLKVLHA